VFFQGFSISRERPLSRRFSEGFTAAKMTAFPARDRAIICIFAQLDFRVDERICWQEGFQSIQKLEEELLASALQRL
jgi:hypothetical protein